MFVTVYFIRPDGSEVRVETILPGTPRKGDQISFHDTETDDHLEGLVLYVHWEDTDGEILVHVHTTIHSPQDTP